MLPGMVPTLVKNCKKKFGLNFFGNDVKIEANYQIDS